MKIRNGFVSNSSSSSFIIIGTPCGNIEDITPKDIRQGVAVIGRYLSEGKDVFELDSEIFEYIKESIDKFKDENGYSAKTDFTFYKNAKIYYESNSDIIIDKSMVNKTIVSGICDQASSYNIDMLKSNYEIDEETDENT